MSSSSTSMRRNAPPPEPTCAPRSVSEGNEYDAELGAGTCHGSCCRTGPNSRPLALRRLRGQGALRGTPASAGTSPRRARVILDPVGARLEPGEILVAPSTDPGWTPLFLTAGGLVMEMGGANSHGAVVAREYGIPAVVGVARATEAITTGAEVTVDGASGVVSLPRGGAAADDRPRSDAVPAPRRGRPPGDQNTRDRVLAAARRTFTERGYDAATLRHIAREAGVDARMVRHYFVDKAGLFRAAMDLPIDPGAVLSMLLSGSWKTSVSDCSGRSSPSGIGPGNANAMIILIRSAMTHDESNRMLREFISSQVLGRIAAAVDAPDRELRASLIGEPDRRPGHGQVHRPGGTTRVRRSRDRGRGDRADPSAVPDRVDRLSRRRTRPEVSHSASRIPWRTQHPEHDRDRHHRVALGL